MLLNASSEIIISGLEAAFTAQLLKFAGHFIKTKKIDFQVLTTTGGMPSSHTAGVTALASAAGLICGFETAEFAIAIGYAIVVMYDAAGLRRAAGKMAVCLNQMCDDIYSQGQMRPERLKELLGHTPFEVFGGAIWGIFLACVNHFYIFR